MLYIDSQIISENSVMRCPLFHLVAIVGEDFPDEVFENIFTISLTQLCVPARAHYPCHLSERS